MLAGPVGNGIGENSSDSSSSEDTYAWELVSAPVS